MLVILLNSLVLFLGAFPSIRLDHTTPLFAVDYMCTLYFIFEVIVKVKSYGWNEYWSKGWNKFDFLIVVISAPLLFAPFMNTRDFGVILILRVGRILRFFKIAKFIPNQDRLWRGIKRALAASIGFLITLSIYNFILALGAAYMFAEVDPEHFGDPIISIYSMFKVFTIEGWYEIPDNIAAHSTPIMAFFARLYFVFTVLTGGLIGLSIANAVFVDEMVMDNTNSLENKIDNLRMELINDVDLLKTSNSEDIEILYKKIEKLLEARSNE